jgi:hypothetical protein
LERVGHVRTEHPPAARACRCQPMLGMPVGNDWRLWPAADCYRREMRTNTSSQTELPLLNGASPFGANLVMALGGGYLLPFSAWRAFPKRRQYVRSMTARRPARLFIADNLGLDFLSPIAVPVDQGRVACLGGIRAWS